MATTHLLRFVASAILVSACSGALAQHVWLDAKGVKQYSDMPPPAGTPASRVLQSPGPRVAAPAAAAAAAATDQVPAPSVAERNAAFEKRRIEQAEREAKEGEQARVAADNARNCDQARAYQRTLANGDRIARLDKNGERVYLTEQDRAQETATVQRALAQCK
jgi:choline dehydrogenase-like flavoprotein